MLAARHDDDDDDYHDCSSPRMALTFDNRQRLICY